MIWDIILVLVGMLVGYAWTKKTEYPHSWKCTEENCIFSARANDAKLLETIKTNHRELTHGEYRFG